MKLVIKHSEDFQLIGDGSSVQWQKVGWEKMICFERGENKYTTRCKVMYSDTGIYFLFDCEDELLNCTITEDMEHLFTEDVVEIFLDPAHAESGEQRCYFEYELSPLDKELVLLVPNDQEHFHGWLPWNYSGKRRTRHATHVRGGTKEPKATCEGWRAEVYIPFVLLTGLMNGTPKSGDQWRANLYRIDHDDQGTTQWAWDDSVAGDFHDFKNFGVFEFE